ncbi:MAG: MazG nucleotide pyrophosphohydrolase domain-containing protein [Nanoarchaeota archaeon]|nr:MazG nucleotide pyrophosphohydrolase domain-containing protein [Nanoarchaeota archaeon]
MTTFDELQKMVDEYCSVRQPRYFGPLSIHARLTEEVGEFAREVNDRHGDKKKRSDELKGSDLVEAADILFTLTCYLNSQNLTWEEGIRLMMEKYKFRDADRFKK